MPSVETEISLIERDKIIIGPVEAVCDPRMKAHCLDPYYKHPKGCPNWNYKKGCPPHIPYFPDIYSKDVYIAAIRFNFAEYLARKKAIHPDWTERALKNPRHWQGHVRSELHRFLERELPQRPDVLGEVIFNPEALGVNLFATCAKEGIILEHIPENSVYNIALIAQRLEATPS
jgi:predicted metal-binding protein